MACGPLKDAIEYGNFTKSVGAYDYCQRWDHHQVPRCNSCVEDLSDGHYLVDYFSILDGACQQRPGNGSSISMYGDPFKPDSTVVITEPGPTYATVPTPDYGVVSLGARVGIAFGGLAFILVLAGFIIVCNGKRRRRAFLRDLQRRHAAEQGWPNPHGRHGGGGDMFETPVSAKPLRGGWDESPISAHTEGTDRTLPRYFSPYSSQFNSPISATDATGGPSGKGGSLWPPLQPHQIQQLNHDQQQRMDQIIQEQSPAHGSPPPAFTQWPSPTQEKLFMQMMHHEKRQNELAIGIALGGMHDDSNAGGLRGKHQAGSPLSPYQDEPSSTVSRKGSSAKGKERQDEAYEMVESPYNSSSANGSGSESGQHNNNNLNSNNPYYKMPAEPQAPVLHHPGYGRQYGSRPGTGSSGGSIGLGLQQQARYQPQQQGGLTREDAMRGSAI